MDRVCGATEGLIDDEHGSFRSRRSYVDQIFTLKKTGEKAKSVCGFYESRASKQCIWVL